MSEARYGRLHFDVVFNVCGEQYERGFDDTSAALSYAAELERIGFAEGGAPGEGRCFGCIESGRYAMRRWEKFQQNPIKKEEMQKLK